MLFPASATGVIGANSRHAKHPLRDSPQAMRKASRLPKKQDGFSAPRSLIMPRGQARVFGPREREPGIGQMAVGVFDSGLGGLTVLSALVAKLPDVPFVYYGDNAHTPYGTRNAEEIYDLTCAGVERLWAEGCDLVILACNTASAAALKRMQETWVPENKRVLGVFVPLIEALTERQWGDNSPPREVAVKHVALFATPATVSSRAFQRELAFRAIGVDVEAQPCGGRGRCDRAGRHDSGRSLGAFPCRIAQTAHAAPASGGSGLHALSAIGRRVSRGPWPRCRGLFAAQAGRRQPVGLSRTPAPR